MYAHIHENIYAHMYTPQIHTQIKMKKYERMEVLGPNEKSPGLEDVPLKETLGSWSLFLLILTSH